jgi:hypothetical protein
MRTHRLTEAVLAVLAGASLAFLTGGTARAAPECELHDTSTGVCLVTVQRPAPTPAAPISSNYEGPQDTGSGASCYIDPGERDHWTGTPGPIACSSEHGFWSNEWQCYLRAVSPQPGADDPAWGGRNPADGGAIYGCYRPADGVLTFTWIAEPPTPAADGPSPREVAEMAVDQMNLQAITIGIVPEPGEGSVGLVGMPVWMWAADPGPSTVGPISATASAGGITVTATARIHDITWDMGDGSTVVCRGAGTPFQESYGRQESPDCGHVYTTSSAGKPGDRFTVTATSDWVITWEGAGQTGTIRMDGLSESVQIAVGEAQVLVTG